MSKQGYILEREIDYISSVLKSKGIQFTMTDKTIGHFCVKRKSDNEPCHFFANTGRIKGYNQLRGFKNFLDIITR